MSNTRRKRMSVQRRLDFFEGIYCPWCEELKAHEPQHLHAQARVVAIEFGWLEEESVPNKQEPPEVASSSGSTNRVPMQRTNGGCSTECA